MWRRGGYRPWVSARSAGSLATTVFPNLIWDPARKQCRAKPGFFCRLDRSFRWGAASWVSVPLRAGGGPRTSLNSVKVELSLDPRLHGDVG